jgi:hypothetical protein
LTTVGILVVVVVGATLSVLVTVTVCTSATDSLPSFVWQVTSSSSAAKTDDKRRGRRSAEMRVVFMVDGKYVMIGERRSIGVLFNRQRNYLAPVIIYRGFIWKLSVPCSQFLYI